MPIDKLNFRKILSIKNNIQRQKEKLKFKEIIFYSLGFACCVRESIQRYLKNESQETGVFDWISTNFNSVVFLFSNIDIKFIKDDFYDTNDISGDSRIIRYKYQHIYSFHDAKLNMDLDEGLNKIIEIFSRRLLRLKNKIINNEKMEFIHCFSIKPTGFDIPTINEIEDFFKAIYKINPEYDFNLHLLAAPDINTDLNYLVLNNKVFIHYLTKDDSILEKRAEQRRHWSWFDVYDKITYKNNI